MPLKPSRIRPVRDRFEPRVNRAPGQGPEGDCHEWTGALNRGYGHMEVDGRRKKATHVAWFLETGVWPTELGLLFIAAGVLDEPLGALHHCDNPACVRFEHLFLGTPCDNMADCARKGRINPCRGERSGRAKLTEAQVRAIRSAARAGISQRELARRFGVSPGTVQHIVQRIIWAHVP